MSESSGLTLLAVLAHPDDETFGPGGTLALYAWRGVQVHLLCATRGEVGTVAPELLAGYASIGDLRQHELECAAETLGLAGVHFLGYRDSGMPGSPDNAHPKALAAAPTEQVAAAIVEWMRRVRPQVVITFDPIGGYRHPDHIACHKATVLAFQAAGDPARFPGNLPPFQPSKLYFHTFRRPWLRHAIRLLPLFGQDPRRWGRNKDIDLVDIAQSQFPVHARIDIRPVADRKERASACHASQLMPRPRGLGRFVFRLSDAEEVYMRAVPPAAAGLKERDLFEGIGAPGRP
ncbi:MAG TPA: PIG-L deacetylase family protein [Anaerolineales bacterium]|nr:PIG-L deacetylase family protein [Anaerolineales bacterium]